MISNERNLEREHNTWVRSSNYITFINQPPGVDFPYTGFGEIFVRIGFGFQYSVFSPVS